jgi:hypothetical protein
MSSVTLNGVTFDDADFSGSDGYGYTQNVTVGGTAYPRFLAMFAAWMADAGTARIATSASSRNAALTGSQTWVLDSDVAYAVGAWVVIARTSAPLTTWYIGQVSGYNSGTKTLTVTISASSGSGGPFTDWTISLSARPMTACRANLLANGGFDVWQNGTSFNSTGSQQFTADRWKFTQSTGSANFVASRQTGTNSQYAMRLQRNAASAVTADLFLQNPLESVDSIALRGKYVTISFDMMKGADLSANVAMQLFSGTGTDEASPRGFTGASSIASLTITPAQLSSSVYTRFSLTTAAPIGASVTQLGLTLTKLNSGTAGSNDWVQIERVQMEEGTVANEWLPTPIHETMAQCLRHFRKSFALATAPAQNAGVTGAMATISHVAAATFGVRVHHDPMRIAPLITTYNPSAANANWRDTTAGADRTVSVGTASETGFFITGSSGAAGSSNYIHFIEDARL